MRFLRTTTATLAAAALLAGCGGDSNDPTTFDPGGTSSDISAAAATVQSAFSGDVGEGFGLVSGYLASLTAPDVPFVRSSLTMIQQSVGGKESREARSRLLQATRSIALARTAVAGSAVILPDEVLGTTFVWSTAEETYVASERNDAPADGVRFVLYALDPVTHEPAAPLNELGYVDLRDLSTATTDVARLIVVSQGVTYFDYSVSASGTSDDAEVDVLGFLSDGDHRVNFDLRNDITVSTTFSALALDYELEFSNVDVTLDYQIDITSWDSGALDLDLAASLRGPHGYLDMTGTETGTAEGDYTVDLTFEVNGDEFAVMQCLDDAPCTITDPQGGELTNDEMNAVGFFYAFSQLGLLLSFELMFPAGAFFPL